MVPMLLRTRWFLSLLAFLLIQGLSASSGAGEPDAEAERMMVRAHQARAVWRDLPGFSADIEVATNGEVVEGRMVVTAEGDLQLDLPDSPQTEWAQRRVQSLVDHRLPPDGERTFDVSFADDAETHPLGRLIRFNHDELHSVYRIQGDVIREVHRVMGPTRFSISVAEVSRNPDGMHLPKSYSVSWWDAETGDLTACDHVHNEWVRIGRWDLPARLLSVRSENDGRRDVGEIVFRNHELFTAAGE